MPTIEIEDFCKAMETWAAACITDLETDSEYMKQWRDDFRRHWEFIHLAIRKSCLLDRLIYGGENLRVEICPEHKGHWSGIQMVECSHRCNHGIELTGWIQNNDDPKSINTGAALVSPVPDK